MLGLKIKKQSGQAIALADEKAALIKIGSGQSLFVYSGVVFGVCPVDEDYKLLEDEVEIKKGMECTSEVDLVLRVMSVYAFLSKLKRESGNEEAAEFLHYLIGNIHRLLLEED